MTHAAHMPRAVEAFGRTDVKVIPAPTCFHRPPEGGVLRRLLPDAGAIAETYAALHAFAGRIWYRLRYGQA